MKKLLLLVISLVFVLAACGGEKSKSKPVNTKSVSTIEEETDCEPGGLILDNDEDPDWEIDLDGDCEGDIEFEGNETKTTHKLTDKIKKATKAPKVKTPVNKTTTQQQPKITQPKSSVSKPKSSPKKSSTPKSSPRKSKK